MCSLKPCELRGLMYYYCDDKSSQGEPCYHRGLGEFTLHYREPERERESAFVFALPFLCLISNW